ncbi:MAG: hypothetical protein QQN63_10875, partial [Nitrosopumilus sp.]
SRSLRKSEAGNIWEWIMSLILIRSGILREDQTWCSYQYEGLLEVTGKVDFIAGGTPDINRANLEELNMPEIFIRAGANIINYLNEKYPKGLPEQPLEIKSCSSFMFEVYETNKSASDNHRIQLYHYLKALDYKQGTIVYISRDDCRMLEITVGQETEGEYKSHIEELTTWHAKKELPPLEKPIVYDKSRFSRNWHIAYSQYLTKLYGYKDQKEFDDKYTPVVSRWNRVLKRGIDGSTVTKKNEEVIKEIEKAGYNFNSLVKKSK